MDSDMGPYTKEFHEDECKRPTGGECTCTKQPTIVPPLKMQKAILNNGITVTGLLTVNTTQMLLHGSKIPIHLQNKTGRLLEIEMGVAEDGAIMINVSLGSQIVAPGTGRNGH